MIESCKSHREARALAGDMTRSAGVARSGYTPPTAKSLAFWEREAFEDHQSGIRFLETEDKFMDENREFPTGGVVVIGDGGARGMTHEEFHLTYGDSIG